MIAPNWCQLQAMMVDNGASYWLAEGFERVLKLDIAPVNLRNDFF